MNKLEYGNINIDYPSTWNELSKRQLLYIGARWQYWAEQVSVGKKFAYESVYLLKIMLGAISLNPFNKVKKMLFKLNDMEVYALSKTVDFILNDNTLTNQLLPYVRIVFKKFYGPDNALKNITIDEFAFADTFISRYLKGKNENDLHLALACLYRPGKKENVLNYGDAREPFNNNKVELYAKSIAKLPYYYKQAILLFYIGSRRAWEKQYPAVFDNEPKQGPDFGWLGVIQSLAGEKFGTVNQVGKTKAVEVFAYIENITWQAEEAAREAERIKRQNRR